MMMKVPIMTIEPVKNKILRPKRSMEKLAIRVAATLTAHHRAQPGLLPELPGVQDRAQHTCAKNHGVLQSLGGTLVREDLGCVEDDAVDASPLQHTASQQVQRRRWVKQQSETPHAHCTWAKRSMRRCSHTSAPASSTAAWLCDKIPIPVGR